MININKTHTSKSSIWSLFFILILFIINGCCLKKGELVSTTRLSVEDRSLVPYQGNESISFQHSEGFQFEVETLSKTNFYNNQEHCEDYVEYEVYNVNFFNDIPNLNVNIQLSKFNSNEVAYFSLVSERTPFQEILPPPTASIIIGEIVFNNVQTFQSLDTDYFISEILYNTTTGIIRINYKDETYVQIVP